MRQKIVAGNWKMHGSLVTNQKLLSQLRTALADIQGATFVVCVPAPYLAQTQAILTASNIAWGAQSMCKHAEGAYTGEVSASMLLDFACRYVIVGHSERRALFGETNGRVAAIFARAQSVGLTPILCVGETLTERESGRAEEVIAQQLDAVLAVSGIAGFAHAIVAYEPVWAIGTGKTASPEQAQAVHAFIRNKLAVLDADIAHRLVIQYGGSVKPGNAAELFAQPDIDGGLIGGASLIADEFVSICKAALS
ncbi:MAG: triose-phosphate isomerase [Sulfuriferula sp.]